MIYSHFSLDNRTLYSQSYVQVKASSQGDKTHLTWLLVWTPFTAASVPPGAVIPATRLWLAVV